MAKNTLQEPKGVPFFSIRSGDTHYAKMEAQIQAYINSSDMGINASRDQDFGWRLGPEWVKKVKAYRRDEAKMERLTDKNGGKRPTVPQILYAIYGEQVRNYYQRKEEESAPFEDQYQQEISDRPTPQLVEVDDEDEVTPTPPKEEKPKASSKKQ
jgi:hypothetical protein